MKSRDDGSERGQARDRQSLGRGGTRAVGEALRKVEDSQIAAVTDIDLPDGLVTVTL